MGTFVAVIVLGLVVAVYARIGWSRMEADCTAERPGEEGKGSVSFSWSWNPTGFTCTYADGGTETSLWF